MHCSADRRILLAALIVGAVLACGCGWGSRKDTQDPATSIAMVGFPVRYNMTYQEALASLGAKSQVSVIDGADGFVSTHEVGDVGYVLSFRKRVAPNPPILSEISLYHISKATKGITSDTLRKGTLAALRGQYDEAMTHLRAAAATGDARAQTELGLLYAKRVGKRANYAEALKWFKKAAAQNDARAEANLAVMYQLGHGVPKSHAVAAEWYEKSAAHGMLEGQYGLATLHALGWGVAQDRDRALRLMAQAAEAGYTKAARYLVCAAPETQRAMTGLLLRQPQSLLMEWFVGKALARLLPGFTVERKDLSVWAVADAMETINPKMFGCSVAFKLDLELAFKLRGITSVPLERASTPVEMQYVMMGQGPDYVLEMDRPNTFGSERVHVSTARGSSRN